MIHELFEPHSGLWRYFMFNSATIGVKKTVSILLDRNKIHELDNPTNQTIIQFVFLAESTVVYLHFSHKRRTIKKRPKSSHRFNAHHS